MFQYTLCLSNHFVYGGRVCLGIDSLLKLTLGLRIIFIYYCLGGCGRKVVYPRLAFDVFFINHCSRAKEKQKVQRM